MKGKEELGFCLVAPGVRGCVVVVTTTFSIRGLLKTPAYYIADSRHLVFQHIP